MTISQQILKEAGEIKGEVKGINQRLDRVNGNLKDHDTRINCNEHKIDNITGKATIIGSIIGFIGAVIIACIAKFKL